MAKCQKLSSYELDDLPDEVILNILGVLDIKGLLLCGQVSKRLRAIANDESLWLKVNLYHRKVPYDFIEKAAGNGCQYLGLFACDIIGFTGISKSSLNLKYLNVRGGCQGLLKLIQNCSSLQKLSVAHLILDHSVDFDFQYICQNRQTLQVLDLQGSKLDFCYHTELVQDLLTNCAYLTELNISTYSVMLLDRDLIKALVDNLTPTILKVSLGGQKNLQDEHVKKLVKRCNNITHLDLSSTSITNNSVHSIIGQLKASLEKLKVSGTEVDLATLLELKSMPTLKTLIVDSFVDLHKEIENLEQQLPHISINKEMEFNIAKPFFAENGSDLFVNTDRIWEIRAKEQNLFAEVEGYSDSIGLI